MIRIRQCLLVLLAFTVILLLLTYHSSVAPISPDYEHIFRQILHHEETATSPSPYNAPYVSGVRNTTGNVPESYLDDKVKKPTGFNKTCARYPSLWDLKFKSDYWQMQKTSNGTVHLLNAYLDRRDGNLLRILATYDVYRTAEPFNCQLWYNTSSPIIVQSQMPFWMFGKGWGADNGYFHHPYLITCPVILSEGALPLSVSIVQKSCDFATNNLKIFYKNEVDEKKKFLVCVKGLSFPSTDNSVRLIEWIELLILLGAQKINFYEFSVHPNVQRVLDYYVDQQFVELTPITLIGDYPNSPLLQNYFLRKRVTPRRLQEVLPYNDCFYKHLDEFKYVTLLDTDEVIVPVENTWTELVQTLKNDYPNQTSYYTRNVYFMDRHLHQHSWFDGIPKYMHMLQHVYRAKNYTKPGHFVKGFHDTQAVVALHNHFPFKCLKQCKPKEINITLAHLNHYRADCAAGVKDCDIMRNESVLDKRVWNFKDELVKRVQRTLEEVGLVAGEPV